MELIHEIMMTLDRIKFCGTEARKDLDETAAKHGFDGIYTVFTSKIPPDKQEAYLAMCKEVNARWHTTNNFKVGDKVYVIPDEHSLFDNYIRGTITEISTDGWGYHLRAFQEDLPGIYMFNQWDKDLIPRTDKSKKFLEKP